MDKAQVYREVDENRKVLEGFKEDESLKENAKGCPRAFCVIVFQENYLPSTGKTVFKYENYRVVVGPKEKIDNLKSTFEKEMKGSFKPIIREQAI